MARCNLFDLQQLDGKQVAAEEGQAGAEDKGAAVAGFAQIRHVDAETHGLEGVHGNLEQHIPEEGRRACAQPEEEVEQDHRQAQAEEQAEPEVALFTPVLQLVLAEQAQRHQGNIGVGHRHVQHGRCAAAGGG